MTNIKTKAPNKTDQHSTWHGADQHMLATPSFLDHLVERYHALVHPPQVCHRQVPQVGVVPHHLLLIQQLGHLNHQRVATLLQCVIGLVLYNSNGIG